MTPEQELPETPADATPPDSNGSAPDSGSDSVAAATEAPPQETEAQKETRARDESGRFAKKSFSERLQENDTPRVDTPKPLEQPAKTYTVPQHWKEPHRKLFETAADPIKEAWLEREKEYAQGIEKKSLEYAQPKKEFDEISQVLAPFQGQMQQLGMRPAQAIGELLNVYHGQQQFLQTFRQNPVAAIQQLAQITGVDVSPLLAEDYIPQPQAQLPPEVAQQLSRLPQLESRLQRFEQDNLASTIEQFANAKDQQGNALRPYFEEVRQHMSALLGSGVAQTLEDAYEQAIYAAPSVRVKIEAERRQAEQLERQKKATQAQRAGDAIRTGGGQGTPAKVKMPFIDRLIANDQRMGVAV